MKEGNGMERDGEGKGMDRDGAGKRKGKELNNHKTLVASLLHSSIYNAWNSTGSGISSRSARSVRFAW